MSDLRAEMDVARERFEEDTSEHVMRVFHDDGLYRHLRFSKPGTWSYGYDLVTWPGYLAIVGDVHDFVFARTADMFEWFVDSERPEDRINPDYWAEKLQAPRGTKGVRRFSHEVFRARAREWLDEQLAEHRLDLLDLLEEGTVRTLTGVVDVDACLADLKYEFEAQIWAGDFDDEEGAHKRLREFTWTSVHTGRTITVRDPWEWDLRGFDPWYLWCCWAIVRGIRTYREWCDTPATEREGGASG